MPPSTWKPATRAAIRAAAVAVAETLGARPYAIVGGAACMLLGSMRLTEDVDLVMPKGTVPEYRRLFRTPEAAGRGFRTGTEQPRHTFHGAEDVLVEFLSPAGMFRGAFDEGTPTVVVDGVRVLHPLRLLDAKSESVFSRGEHKKHTDAEDIGFLLGYCADHGLEITAESVPHAHPEVVEYLISEGWVPREAWVKAGYVPGGKSFDHMYRHGAHRSMACRRVEAGEQLLGDLVPRLADLLPEADLESLNLGSPFWMRHFLLLEVTRAEG